jgi:hypothetical protein
MGNSTVKLKLNLATFNEDDFADQVRLVEKDTSLNSMYDLGDNEENRRRLYELNKSCSVDIPGRGEFYTYEEFCKFRYGSSYDPSCAIIAIKGLDWVGLSVNSNWSNKGFLFSEMTGVIREHRRKNIALVMKIYGIRAAIETGAKWIYTITGTDNPNSVEMNLRLGFAYTDWDTLL